MTYAQTVTGDDVVLLLGVLQRPVQIVTLDLHELEFTFVLREEFLQELRTAVVGEAQVADLALVPHLEDVRDDVVVLALVDLDRPLRDVVQEVEVEIIRLALLQGNVEQGDVVDGAGEGVTGELVRDVVAVPGILAQGFRHRQFGFAVEIGVGRVEVVDAGGDGRVEHGVDLGLVDLARRRIRGKAHAAKAETGELHSVEIAVNHGNHLSPCFADANAPLSIYLLLL